MEIVLIRIIFLNFVTKYLFVSAGKYLHYITRFKQVERLSQNIRSMSICRSV